MHRVAARPHDASHGQCYRGFHSINFFRQWLRLCARARSERESNSSGQQLISTYSPNQACLSTNKWKLKNFPIYCHARCYCPLSLSLLLSPSLPLYLSFSLSLSLSRGITTRVMCAPGFRGSIRRLVLPPPLSYRALFLFTALRTKFIAPEKAGELPMQLTYFQRNLEGLFEGDFPESDYAVKWASGLLMLALTLSLLGHRGMIIIGRWPAAHLWRHFKLFQEQVTQ